jgi:hypothetical protein
MSPFQKIVRDPALWTLIAINILFIYEFRDDPKHYTTIIWMYWCQSVLLGLFTFAQMLSLNKNLPEKSTPVNGDAVNIKKARGCMPFFFLFHYGMFHLVYFVFLLVDFRVTNLNFSLLKWSLAGIILNQLIIFIQHKTKNAETVQSMGWLFFVPYLRIVPMHLTILLPRFMGWQPAILFLILKTVFDIIGHIITTPYYWNNKADKPEKFI